MIKVETHKKDRFNAQKSMKERKMLHERGMRSDQPALPCRPVQRQEEIKPNFF